MEILELPLFIFKDYYWDTLLKAQKDTYPFEPEVNKEYLEYFDDVSVVFALKNKEVLGFIVWMSCTEPRTNETFGTSLWVWVELDKRNSLVAGKLIKEVEKNAKLDGCLYFKWDVNVDSDLIKALDKRVEYRKESVIYTKYLDTDNLN